MSDLNSPHNNTRSGIGTLNENSLHADIIKALAQDNDILEADFSGFFIDILRQGKAVEVQTSNLGKLSKKVLTLAEKIPVEIVYPIQKSKLITKINADEVLVSQRKSPKEGRLVDVFEELVRATNFLAHPAISLVVLIIDAEEIWRDDGKGSWRRKGWSIHERNLIRIVSKHRFSSPEDLLRLLPKSLPTPFTNQELSKALSIRPRLAGKITYSLRKMDLLEISGKRGKSYLFEIL